MMRKFLQVFICIGLTLSCSACQPSILAAPTIQTNPVDHTDANQPGSPYEMVSLDSLLAYLGDLTSIQPYSGWRNSASSGEAQALDYVYSKLEGFSNLLGMGLELERQSFPVYLSTEFRESGLTLTINGNQSEIPAQGLRGARYDRRLAAYLDSDGRLNDSDANPETGEGAPLVARDDTTFGELIYTDLRGKVLFLNYSLLDRYVNSHVDANSSQLMNMIDQGLAGVVLVTQFSNHARVSHGTVLADGSVFQVAIPSRRVPVVFVRMEDLQPAGIRDWAGLGKISSVKVTLDTDVYSPGQSGNLVARIPGQDSSRAIILGAHIDSPNSPGAFDDGSGSAALLEIARVLDQSQTIPPVDLYLAWFGGHEIGIYGSSYFVSTHQELLDRSVAAVIMDCLGHPLDGNTSSITMYLTSYGRFGDESLPLPDYMSAAVADHEIVLDHVIEYGIIADNSNFDAFNVPELDLLYMNGDELQSRGASYAHYANHWHDPYESLEQVREVGDAYVGMTQVLLSAVLKVGDLSNSLRVAPAPDRHALIVGSHTESTTVVTALLRELGMALAWDGFDVDLIPYGQQLSQTDLQAADIVIIPPTLDYPGQHNEAWRDEELSLLNGYVTAGGFLMVVNSEFNFSTMRMLEDDHNEDTRVLNSLLEPMGIKFNYGSMSTIGSARAASAHPLSENVGSLSLYKMNVVPFTLQAGTILADSAGVPVIGLIDYGEEGGQVLVVSDIGLLQADQPGAGNLQFLKNIARYARMR